MPAVPYSIRAATAGEDYVATNGRLSFGGNNGDGTFDGRTSAGAG